ncbi:putative peptide chain release factor class I [Helianthus anomalus]
MDTYKASGPGGQHHNKRENAVRIKHIPTGLLLSACGYFGLEELDLKNCVTVSQILTFLLLAARD